MANYNKFLQLEDTLQLKSINHSYKIYKILYNSCKNSLYYKTVFTLKIFLLNIVYKKKLSFRFLATLIKQTATC